MPVPKSIPPVLEPKVLEQAGLGLSHLRIAQWLKAEHGVKTSPAAVGRLLTRIAKQRAPIARAIAQEKLTKTVTADLDAVDEILLRARRDEQTAIRLADVQRELECMASVDVGRAVGPDGNLLPLHPVKVQLDGKEVELVMPEDVRRAIASIEVEELFEGHGADRERIGTLTKVKFWDKNRANDLLGKLRAGVMKRDLALRARDQQLAALTLRLKLAGAGGGNDEELDALRDRIAKKLDAASA